MEPNLFPGDTIERFAVLKLKDIEPNPWQPRAVYKKEDLQGLAESIRQLGVIQPIVVRPHPKKDGKFQVACGGRRKLASEIADRDEIPTMVRDLDDKGMEIYAIAENVHRAQMEDADKEAAYYRLWETQYKNGHREGGDDGDIWTGASQMAKDLGFKTSDGVRGTLEAYAQRRNLKLTSSTLTTSDFAKTASLAKEDPKAAKALLRARAEDRIGARELEKAAPVIRAHKTPEARAQAVDELLKAKDAAEDYQEEVRKEIKSYSDKPKTEIKVVRSGDKIALDHLAKVHADLTYYAQYHFVNSIEDPRMRARAIELMENMAVHLAKEIHRLQEKIR